MLKLRNFYHICNFSTLAISFSEVWSREIPDPDKQFNLIICLENVLKISLQDVLKMSWRRFWKMSWRRLEDVLKMFWRRYEDVWPRQIYWSWSRCLEGVFWRRMSKANHGLLYLHSLTLCILKKKIAGQTFKRSFASK